MLTKKKNKTRISRCPRCYSKDWSEELQFCVECCIPAEATETLCPKCGSLDFNSDLDLCLDCDLSDNEEPITVVNQVPNYSEDDYTASICRSSLYEFVKEFWDEVSAEVPVWNWHIPYLCNELQKIAERVFLGLPKEYDLLINISPGTTKSTIASIMFPAWCWTRKPSTRVIGASYAHSLSTELARKNRDVVKSEKYQRLFPDVRIRDDQDAKGFFINTAKGDRFSVGVNGSVMGMHGHFIIVDDPLDPQQAMSEAEINIANHWMSETLPSRKVDKSVTPLILIMQRLHQNDPTGFRIARAKESAIRHICLPAEMAPNITPAGLKVNYTNGLMDPRRLNKKVLDEAREDLGEYGYAGQHMQNPVPRGGALFDVEKLKIDYPPQKFRKTVRFWDKAGTLRGGNYTAGVKMAEDFDGRIWILEVIRNQWDTYRREMAIKQAAILDGRTVQIGIEAEGGSGGKESAENTVRNLRGWRVIVVRVSTSEGAKINRAEPFSSQVNSGNVYLAKAHWNIAFKTEMEYFPKGKLDDQIDAAGGAFNLLMKTAITVGGFASMARTA